MKEKSFNREQVRKPKLGRHWCVSCDSYLVAKGQKCPVCKHSPGPARNKK